MVASLFVCYQLQEPASKMPGHDHSLRKLYTIEGLSNPSMVYNWICPILHETLHQKDALVSTFFCLFLSLKIVTMFCNLVLLNVCKYFTLPTLLYSLRVSAVLDHFGYLAPHLDQWQQPSGMTWELPKKYYIICVFTFHKAFPRLPVLQGPSHLLPLAGQL